MIYGKTLYKTENKVAGCLNQHYFIQKIFGLNLDLNE